MIEVDITNPSLDKLPIYARFRVPEVWRYDGRELEIRAPETDRYAGREESEVLPGVSASALVDILEESKALGLTSWQRRVREWARQTTEPGP